MAAHPFQVSSCRRLVWSSGPCPKFDHRLDVDADFSQSTDCGPPQKLRGCHVIAARSKRHGILKAFRRFE
jgi:hypothetical protein